MLEKQSICGYFPGFPITDICPPRTATKRCVYRQEQTDKNGNRESSHPETCRRLGSVRLGRATARPSGNFSDRQLFPLAIGKDKFLELCLWIPIRDSMLKSITEIEIRGLFLFLCLDAHDFDGVSILAYDKLLFNLLYF